MKDFVGPGGGANLIAGPPAVELLVRQSQSPETKPAPISAYSPTGHLTRSHLTAPVKVETGTKRWNRP